MKISYENFIQMAKENYKKGGHTVLDTWEKSNFLAYERMFGAMTKGKAKEIFHNYYLDEKYGEQ